MFDSFVAEDFLQLGLAVVVGGLIGAEREYRDKSAGFRTLIFICVGSALFTILSKRLAGDHDPSRIAAQIVSGIGFLGAGVILRERGRVHGLTTAATIWVTAALGMGLAAGHYALVGATVIASIVVLQFFPLIEALLARAKESRTYEIVCAIRPEGRQQLLRHFQATGLRAVVHKQLKTGDGVMTMICQVDGSAQQYEKLNEALLMDEQVREYRY